MSTAEKDRVDSQEDGSTSAVEEAPVRRSRKGRKSKSRRSEKSQSGPLDQLPLNNVTDDALGNVTNTLGGVTGGVLNQGGQESGGGGKQDTLRLRLDLNLELEIQLKARIHGDLELALLTG